MAGKPEPIRPSRWFKRHFDGVRSADRDLLLMLMPEVARAFGIQNPFDPRENIMGGTRLLRELLDSHHDNIRLVLAADNAGPAAVARYRGVPPFRETRGYVKKITGLLADARHAGDN